MRCQSPALPHCHGLLLATSLMRLPREHCIVITYIIIIILAWGCLRHRGPCCCLPPAPASPAARGIHQCQHLLTPRAPKQDKPCNPEGVRRSGEVSRAGGRRDLPYRPAWVLLFPPASLHPFFPKFSTSPTEFRAWAGEGVGKAQAALDWGDPRRRGLTKLPQPFLSSSSCYLCHLSPLLPHQKALP